MLNTWEAVYFDHDLDDAARAWPTRRAAVGVERFVLDDGWFRGRRDDSAGLGDWYRRPDGLAGRARPARRPRPRARHAVRALVRAGDGQPRLATSPESIRTGSSAPPRRRPGLRHQHVLDLAHPDAYDYVLEPDRRAGQRVRHRLHQVGPQPRPASRPATATRAAGPASTRRPWRSTGCSTSSRPATRGWRSSPAPAAAAGSTSGILDRTDRVWASDCNDPVERQQIQRWTAQLVPPELIGAHVAAERSHTTTGRRALSFRLVTALFGHAGIE